MTKDELTAKLARSAGLSRAAAADRVDQVVNEILARLRRGESASLPGLGTFRPGAVSGFTFESDPARKRVPRRRR